jgi:putative addiction module component (TIGR02574 family)
MSDLRSQINSLSPAEKEELLDTVWESLEADSASLTDAQRAELDYRIARHEQNPSMSFRGSKSGRACLRSRDNPLRTNSLTCTVKPYTMKE